MDLIQLMANILHSEPVYCYQIFGFKLCWSVIRSNFYWYSLISRYILNLRAILWLWDNLIYLSKLISWNSHSCTTFKPNYYLCIPYIVTILGIVFIIICFFIPKLRNLSRSAWNSRRLFQYRRCELGPWVEKITWKREWLPTPVFWPGELHGQRSLAVYSPWSHKQSTWLSNEHFQTVSTKISQTIPECNDYVSW